MPVDNNVTGKIEVCCPDCGHINGKFFTYERFVTKFILIKCDACGYELAFELY